jgi:hypothetical protein
VLLLEPKATAVVQNVGQVMEQLAMLVILDTEVLLLA